MIRLWKRLNYVARHRTVLLLDSPAEVERQRKGCAS